MATCWSELFADLGEPVRGQPDDYVNTARHADGAGAAVATCATGLAALAAGDASQLRGAAADALGSACRQFDDSLRDVPRVLESLAAVMVAHAERLDALRAEAAAALERASARWTSLRVTEATVVDRTAALAAIERQLQAARAAALAGDTDAPARLDQLEAQRWTAWARADAAEHDHTAARADHAASRAEHTALVEAEQELVAATWMALGEIDLGGVRDPSGLSAAIGTVAGWAGTAWEWSGGALVAMVDSVIDASVAVLDGRFLDALHHLNDAIGEALKVTTALAIVAVVAGSTVCPGALVVLPGLIAASQGLSYAGTATMGALALSQHPHPDTGDTVGVVDVLAAGVATAVGGGGVGRRSAAAVRATGRAQAAALSRAGAGPSAGRVFVRTAAENRSVVRAAGAGAARIGNPATGRLVAGAARQQLVERATLELAADEVLGQLGRAIDGVIVGNVAGEITAGRVRDDLAAALAAVHPDAEATLDRVVLGTLSHQLGAVADAWRSGPSAHPQAAPYHVLVAA